MDTLTHAALGAAIGEATLGKHIGWRAAGMGAIIANLPDIDILSGLFISKFELILIHRGVTHSLIFCVIVGAMIGWWLNQKFSWVNYQRLTWMAVLCLLSHVMLDTFNSVGTQLLYPVSNQVYALGNIHVIDPLYTIPLVVFTIMGVTRRQRKWRKILNNTGLVISSLYLILTITNQAVAEAIFTNALHLQGKSAQRKITHPTALNNIIWFTVAESPSGYYVGFCDLRNDSYEIPFQFIPKNTRYESHISSKDLRTQLNSMSNGYLAYDSTYSKLFCFDMRLGLHFSDLRDSTYQPKPILSFQILEGGNRKEDIIPLGLDLGLTAPQLRLIWHQIRHRTIL